MPYKNKPANLTSKTGARRDKNKRTIMSTTVTLQPQASSQPGSMILIVSCAEIEEVFYTGTKIHVTGNHGGVGKPKPRPKLIFHCEPPASETK